MTDLRSLTAVLKTLSDYNRLRVLSLLDGNELTVKEMLEILQLSQSTLSSQLSQLKDSGLVQSRREGLYVYYKLPRNHDHSFSEPLLGVIQPLTKDAEWYERDQRNLKEVLKAREAGSWQYFGDRNVQNSRSPGQTWESFALGIMSLLPPSTIADFGCGMGRLASLLAEHGHRVIGIDNNGEQIKTATKLHPNANLKFVKADMERSGIDSSSQNIVIVSQALHHSIEPGRVISEAERVLHPGGQILILDLHQHELEWLPDRFGDHWMGFDREQVEGWCAAAGFRDITIRILQSDSEHSEIDTMIIHGRKPAVT